jgi:hypothetical protein
MQSEKVRTLDKPYEIKLRIPAQHCLENTSFVLEWGRRLIFGFHEAAMYYCLLAIDFFFINSVSRVMNSFE